MRVSLAFLVAITSFYLSGQNVKVYVTSYRVEEQFAFIKIRDVLVDPNLSYTQITPYNESKSFFCNTYSTAYDTNEHSVFAGFGPVFRVQSFDDYP